MDIRNRIEGLSDRLRWISDGLAAASFASFLVMLQVLISMPGNPVFELGLVLLFAASALLVMSSSLNRIQNKAKSTDEGASKRHFLEACFFSFGVVFFGVGMLLTILHIVHYLLATTMFCIMIAIAVFYMKIEGDNDV